MVDIKSNEKPERATTTGNKKQRKVTIKSNKKQKRTLVLEKPKRATKGTESPIGNQAIQMMLIQRMPFFDNSGQSLENSSVLRVKQYVE